MLTATNPLLCNMTVTLLWKCNELIVTQQELLRYYSNATKALTCHNNEKMLVALLVSDDLLSRDFVSYGIVFFNVCGVMAVVMVMLLKFYVP
jgi:hypothetical protein